MNSKRLAGLGLATVMAAGLTPPQALAMESTMFAGDAAEAEPVVSVRVEDKDPADGVCTGTAIGEHWVITARHCVEAAKKLGGSVRTGQGDMQKVYEVDRWEVAPRGDIALAHTVQPMQLSRFAEIADTVPDGDVNIYGWSSDGSGGSERLPSAEAEVRGESPLALFEAPTALHVALKNGARIQPGDSGGAIFDGGKVAGIMSAGLFEDPDNPTEEEMTSNAAVAVAPVADQASWIRETISQAEANPADSMRQNGDNGLWWKIAAGAGVLVLLAALAMASARNRKAPLD
ncbi:trypsin-like serine protease [Corynebacterium aquatimens]|uniref:trypsin-like serine protease n=1 Tax=Corynebacterium TaxID=1716 RepID=UPI001F3CF533|nr:MULTISPECIES: trypsin-like serine protease [Corynebacterium]QYH19964.1 trypsin-like serine protease [Corynebacterium aquatimens]UIZ92854.1 trypsin-like serine protease [Corynebacterium sp. CNCTC7651]